MKPDWNRWHRRHRTLSIAMPRPVGARSIPWNYATVSLVRKGVWRASMLGLRDSASFNRMEDALLWAEARLPLYELRELA